jgi:hypothetical protein
MIPAYRGGSNCSLSGSKNAATRRPYFADG